MKLTAAWMEFFEIAIYLIENGADVKITDPTGRTPLHMLGYTNCYGIITHLIIFFRRNN